MTTQHEHEHEQRNFVHTIEVLMASALAARDLAGAARSVLHGERRRKRAALAVAGSAIVVVLCCYAAFQPAFLNWSNEPVAGPNPDGEENIGPAAEAARITEQRPARLMAAAVDKVRQERVGRGELSDQFLFTLMKNARGMATDTLVTPLGRTIVADRSASSESLPMDSVREVIYAARLTADARRCELTEEERAYYQTYLRREEEKGKWSDQQLLFINQLYQFTVLTLTGKVQPAGNEGDGRFVVRDGGPAKTEACSEVEKKKIEAQITAFINDQPAAGRAPRQSTPPRPKQR